MWFMGMTRLMEELCEFMVGPFLLLQLSIENTASRSSSLVAYIFHNPHANGTLDFFAAEIGFYELCCAHNVKD